jgi:hypothetical protein
MTMTPAPPFSPQVALAIIIFSLGSEVECHAQRRPQLAEALVGEATSGPVNTSVRRGCN